MCLPSGEESDGRVVDRVQGRHHLLEAPVPRRARSSRSRRRQLLLQALQEVALVVVVLGQEEEDDAALQSRLHLSFMSAEEGEDNGNSISKPQ